MDDHLIIYLVATALVGVAAMAWLMRILERTESKSANQADKLDDVNPVKTSTPLNNPLKKAREIASKGVVGRFSIIRRILLIFVFVIWLLALVFPFLGRMPATIISILVTATAVLIGIVAKPFVDNLVSGILISFSRIFNIGDTLLIDENYGTVEDITLTHTIIKLWDWRRYVIPNSVLLNKDFVNYSMFNTAIWAYVEFNVAYDADINEVKQAAVRLARESDYFFDCESPRFWIMETGTASVKCWIAAWAKNPSNAWMLRNDIRTGLCIEFPKMGVKTHLHHYQGLS